MITPQTALTIGVALTALLHCRPSRAAQTVPPTLTVLYSFSTLIGDGRYPSAGVVIGSGGLLYGTTPEGGFTSAGTVYSLTPPTTTGGAWTETVLYRFDRHDGAFPYAGVVIGAGVLYGTTFDGGTGAYCSDSVLECGVVFSLAPPATPGGPWTETVLYTFSGASDGSNPGSVVIGSGGVLYGTTSAGGSAGLGTVFSLTPPASPGGAWTETVLHSFTGPDGSGPSAPLIIGRHGVLYGATGTGGTGACGSGCGTVFSLTPPASPGGPWTEAVLHSFAGSPGDGENPVGMVTDGRGDLYGTTSAGGTGACSNTYPPCGTVFSLTAPAAAGSDWTEKVLYNFPTTSGGYTPNAGVVILDGVLYGTTVNGGNGNYGNYGTVFSLTPPTSTGGAWTETVLHSFSGGNDGAHPTASLAVGRDGLLYGTTSAGGSGKFGTVFSLKP